LLAAVLMSAAGDSSAEPTPNPASADPELTPSLYDKIWRQARLYESQTNPVIQSLDFTGRFQVDYATINQADFDDLNIRRFRLGGKAKLFHHFTVHAEVDLAPEQDPVYSRLTDAYVAWTPQENLEFTLGKRSAPFTMDGSTSSRDLLTIDRANLANNLWFPQEYIPGLTVRRESDHWQYMLGVYSSGSANREFGNFDGKYFLLTTLGYNFAELLGTRDATLAADYVYNEPDSRNTFTRPLEQVGSLHFKFDQGKWGFRTDLTGGIGYLGQSDLWGTMFMTHYMLTRRLQIVGRYTFLQSADNNGVLLARYENRVVSGKGDQYQEFYAGLNYYFYGHKLKVQTGVQYAEMRDRANDGGQYYGWAWTTGLRISW
jgi:phosphate-selective porin OprO/OprP